MCLSHLSNFVISWSIWSVIIYGYPHLHLCHLLINLSLPYIIYLVSYLFFHLICIFYLPRFITSEHVNLSISWHSHCHNPPPPISHSLLILAIQYFSPGFSIYVLFHFCTSATIINHHAVSSKLATNLNPIIGIIFFHSHICHSDLVYWAAGLSHPSTFWYIFIKVKMPCDDNSLSNMTRDY